MQLCEIERELTRLNALVSQALARIEKLEAEAEESSFTLTVPQDISDRALADAIAAEIQNQKKPEIIAPAQELFGEHEPPTQQEE